MNNGTRRLALSGLVLAAIVAAGFATKEKSYQHSTANKMAQDTFKLELTRSFNAPLEKVWNAWTVGTEIKKWWGPTGFTCPLAEVDFTVGGVSVVCMKAPAEFGGAEMYNTWTYRKIMNKERIEFVQGWVDKDRNPIPPSALGLPAGIPAEVPHTITFRKLSPGRTEITIIETGYSNPEIVEISRMGMTQCLDKMEKMLEGA